MGSIKRQGFRGVVYRATTYDTPLWVHPNRRPGRWHVPTDDTIVQYCSFDPAAPLAEMVRHEEMTEEIAEEARIGLWQLRVNEGSIVDLSGPELAAAAGISWSGLTDDDWSECQTFAADLRHEGVGGILAPSAALPGGVTVVLFGPRTELAWKREPAVSIQVPCRKILRGAPGADVVRATRSFGEEFPPDSRCPSLAHMLSGGDD